MATKDPTNTDARPKPAAVLAACIGQIETLTDPDDGIDAMDDSNVQRVVLALAAYFGVTLPAAAGEGGRE